MELPRFHRTTSRRWKKRGQLKQGQNNKWHDGAVHRTADQISKKVDRNKMHERRSSKSSTPTITAKKDDTNLYSYSSSHWTETSHTPHRGSKRIPTPTAKPSVISVAGLNSYALQVYTFAPPSELPIGGKISQLLTASRYSRLRNPSSNNRQHGYYWYYYYYYCKVMLIILCISYPFSEFKQCTINEGLVLVLVRVFSMLCIVFCCCCCAALAVGIRRTRFKT